MIFEHLWQKTVEIRKRPEASGAGANKNGRRKAGITPE
jgi:hypothetical protein